MSKYEFIITNRTTKEKFTVYAYTVEQAADIAFRKICPNTRSHKTIRVTGDSGKSGIFQGYKELGGGQQLTSVGPQFNVS
jgi:hypothetical protein